MTPTNLWKCFLLCVLAGVVSGSMAGQGEAELKSYFEGRKVEVRLDMPGSSDGIDVDVFQDGSSRVDFNSYSKRLKQYGISLHDGDQILVTKVKVKGDHIEFQLGGGGFGTALDDASLPPPFVPAEKSQREKDLEKRLDQEKDPKMYRTMSDELRDLRWKRERDDDRRRREIEQATAIKAEQIQRQREQGGSRFNFHYGGKNVPVAELVPDRLVQVLKPHVFCLWLNPPPPAPGAPAPPAASGDAAGGPDDPAARLRKGMSVAETDRLLGPPLSIDWRDEGALRLMTRKYQLDGTRVEADFYEDALIRYTVTR